MPIVRPRIDLVAILLSLVAVSASAPAETTTQGSLSKKWKVYVAQSAHTDLGYTDFQKNVIDLHNRNTDKAIALGEKYPGYQWNLECSWAAQMYERNRPPEQVQKLLQQASRRRIGIEANYVNLLTGLCSAEELTRMLYYSAGLARKYGVPFESVTLSDTPSYVWSLPTVLRRAGIKYLSMGINQVRGPMLRGPVDELSPVWWEGPDGSKVLSWFSDAYAWADRIGLDKNVETVAKRLGDLLAGYEKRNDYPYDAVLLHGAIGDNERINEKVADTVVAWNAKHTYPKIILGSMSDFFRYIEENFADRIPTIRGCGGSYWEDGAASSARETAVNRNNHERIVTAEGCWAALAWLGKAETYPQARITAVWDNILLFDEHTWGARQYTTKPTDEFVVRQWEVKAAYATDAERDSMALLSEGLKSLGRSVVGRGAGILVYNPVSWERSEVVGVVLPKGKCLADPDGRKLKVQTLSVGQNDSKACFLADRLPGLGYRRYEIVEASPEQPRVPAGSEEAPTVLENRFYRVVLDGRSGGISGIVDKQTGVELTDPSSSYKLGEVIYASGGKGTQAIRNDPELPPAKFDLSRPEQARWQMLASGPVARSARSFTSTKMLPGVGLEVTLYDDVKRIDLTVHLDKTLTYEKEAVYVAFPFAAEKPAFRMEVGGGWVRPNEDHLPGACLDWFSVQNAVTLDTGKGGICWSSVDTPLITLCDITTGRWLERLPITNGTIFAYVMNNYWFTNYKAGQDGKLALRFSIASEKSMDTIMATRHGWSAARPLLAEPVEVSADAILPPEGSFCRIDAPNVVLSAFKKAEDGEGFILRFLDVGGKAIKVAVGCGVLPALGKAWRCDSVERDLGPLPVHEGTVSLDIAAFGIETVRVAR